MTEGEGQKEGTQEEDDGKRHSLTHMLQDDRLSLIDTHTLASSTRTLTFFIITRALTHTVTLSLPTSYASALCPE